MILYEQFILKVKNSEGFRSKIYKCPSGHYTIGFGIRCEHGHAPITLSDADVLLRNELRKIEDSFQNYPFVLLDHERYALVDLVFNCGAAAFEKSNLFKLLISYSDSLDKRNFTLADKLVNSICANLLTWCHGTVNGKKVVLDGLKIRCQWRSQLFKYGRIY